MKLIRNNTQWIVGFVDALLEEADQSNPTLKSKLNGYEVSIEFVNDERTQVEINFNVVDQKQEDDYTTKLILIPNVTTISGFANLVLQAIEEIRSTIKEIQND